MCSRSKAQRIAGWGCVQAVTGSGDVRSEPHGDNTDHSGPNQRSRPNRSCPC